jgi:FdhE protein
MSETGAPRRSPIPIGEAANPPVACLPDPSTMFRARAQRFATLSQGHALEPYLRFLAGLAEAQHRCQEGLSDPVLPPAEARERGHEFGMPPLDRGRFAVDDACTVTFARLFALAAEIEMPEPARLALGRVTALDAAGRNTMAHSVLSDWSTAGPLAEHTYVAAALQVHFARLAARLEVGRLTTVAHGACPCCGSAPVSSLVVGWQGAHGTRFCACSLCATLWHVVRIKCALCGSTKGISYREIEGGPGAGKIRAETCESCHGYLKIMQQQVDPALNPVADDVATLALDLLVREAGYHRGGVNFFLQGY